ncbi:MAG: hypothetical protein AAGM67_19970, partial [Bacteroidota bacterium]
MNKLISNYQHLGLLAALMIASLGLFAQDPQPKPEPAQTDSTEIIFKNRRIIIIADEEGKRVEIKEIKEDGTEESTEIQVEDPKVIIIEEEGDDDYDYTAESEEEYDEEYEDEYEGDWDDEDDYDHKAKTKRSGKRTDVDLLGLDIGFTNYYNSATGQYGLAAAPSSLAIREFRPGSHVALHLFPTTASLAGRGTINLKTALTIDWTQLYFSSNVRLNEVGGALDISQSPNNLSKNKLTARYVQMPLLLNVNTDPGGNDGVSISFGVYGGLLWKGWTKSEYAENGQTIVDKIDGSYGLTPIRYG